MTQAHRRPPLPPFTIETAVQKVRAAEDAWNSRDPEKVSLAYTEDSRWRNRAEFVSGRDQIVPFLLVRYGCVPVNTYIGCLREQGMPKDMQWLLRELFTVVLDGRNSNVAYGVAQALGRPATDFKAYVCKAIDAGAWAARSVATAGESS